MAKSTRQRAHHQGTNARNRIVRRPAHGVVRPAAPDLSRDGRRRLAMVDWHRDHGGNVPHRPPLRGDRMDADVTPRD